MSAHGPLLGVGAIVVERQALLMVRRGREPALGLWSLPGGRVEQGERLEDAVLREVREETGLEVEVTGLAGLFEVFDGHHFVVVDFFARPTGDTSPIAGSDAVEARWVPLDDIETLECTPRLVETLEGWNVLPERGANKRGGPGRK